MWYAFGCDDTVKATPGAFKTQRTQRTTGLFSVTQRIPIEHSDNAVFENGSKRILGYMPSMLIMLTVWPTIPERHPPRDLVSPLWFYIALNPLSWLLYDAGVSRVSIKHDLRAEYELIHLIYLDDDQLGSLLCIVDMLNRDVECKTSGKIVTSHILDIVFVIWTSKLWSKNTSITQEPR